MSIEGQLAIHVGLESGMDNRVSIHSTRRVEAAALLEGQPVRRALELLPLVFSVCGMAQGCAGLRAVESVLGKEVSAELERRRRRLVAMETLREHLWRILLDWTGSLGLEPEKGELAEVLAIQRRCREILFPRGLMAAAESADVSMAGKELDAVVTRIERVVEEQVFGMPVSRWLELDSRQRLEKWMEHSGTVAARYLRLVKERGWASLGRNDIAPLPALEADQLKKSMESMDFIRAPTWRGDCHETSACTRIDSPLLTALREEFGNGLMTRLAARLVEVAHLAKLPPVFPESTESLEKVPGLGGVEAARGLLVHQVILTSDERIHRYRILAPTEWNFHPEGVVARALATLEGDPESVEEQARHLIHAVDPCVGYELTVGWAEGTAR